MGTLNTAVGTPPAGTGGGGGGGTTDHAALSNRSASSQHPQSAITGLVGDLAAIVASVTAAITTAQARGGHTGTQLAATISDLTAAVNTLIAAAGATGTGNLVRASAPVLTGATAAADPVTALGLATKQYTDGLATNLGKRQRVRAASTANINLAAPGAAIDGVTMVAGDWFLPKDQSTPAQNGVYVWNGAAVAATRAPEFDTYDEHPGSLIVVQEGTVNAETMWICTSNVGGTLGSTALAFSANSTPTVAASVSVADAGAYFAGTTVEAVTQELGAAQALKEKAWVTQLVTGTSLTLAATDDRKTFIFTNAAAIAVGVPTAASGIRCQFVWAGSTGRITVTPSSTNINGAATAIDLSDAAGCAELIPTGTANDWTMSGAIGNLSPADITGNTFAICATFPEGADETFVLCQYAPFPFTINSSVTDCNGGTATYRLQIEGVNVGSTANAVSTTEESQAHATANAVVLGDTVQLVKTSNAACVMGRVTVLCTRTG